MLYIAVVALCSLTAHCVTAATLATGNDDENELSIDLDHLNRRLETVDLRPHNVQSRSCNLGIHNHNCVLQELQRAKAALEFLTSGESPGKRDSQQSDDASENDLLPSVETGSFEISQDVDEQRQAISKLRYLLNAMRPVTENIPTVKKNCSVRLGGHCLTESLDRAANQYYYLKSPNSPGRRRRGVSTSFQEQARQCMYASV